MSMFRTYLCSSTSWYLTHPHKFVHDLWRDIKAFFQRGNRGYADCDLWGFDWYLSEIIVSGLSYFKENIHGCPAELSDNCNIEEGCRKWKEVLEKITKAFELNLRQINWEKLTDEEIVEREEGLRLFCYWINNLWD